MEQKVISIYMHVLRQQADTGLLRPVVGYLFRAIPGVFHARNHKRLLNYRGGREFESRSDPFLQFLLFF